MPTSQPLQPPLQINEQTTILEREVYLVEKLAAASSNHEPMMHLRAVCFLRPTGASSVHCVWMCSDVRLTGRWIPPLPPCHAMPCYDLTHMHNTHTTTEENAALLARELAAPKYAEYHLFFSNLVPPALLRAVAEADELDSVRQVHIYTCDVCFVGFVCVLG